MSHHAAVHGAWCNSRVFRMTCRDCGESVWYFTCNCGCKVFFDELGHPWPLHKERCYRAIMREHNISEEVARKMILGALKDQRKPIVAIDELFEKQIIQKKDFDIPIKKAELDDGESYSGVGIVREVIKTVDWRNRYKMSEGSFGEKLVAKAFGDDDWGQITIHVREVANQQYSSYTTYIKRSMLKAIKKGIPVEFSIVSKYLYGDQSATFINEISTIEPS